MTDRLQVTGDDGRVWEWEHKNYHYPYGPKRTGWIFKDETGPRPVDKRETALLSEVVKLRADLDLALQALAAGGREFLLGTVESVKGAGDE